MLSIAPTTYPQIQRLRDLYRQELHCQIVHDSYHERGFTALYLLQSAGSTAGYAAVGDYDSQGKDVVTEFYLTPTYRAEAQPFFQALIEATGATQIETQTNDLLLLLMLYDFCAPRSIHSDRILFADVATTCLPVPEGITLRRVPVTEPPGGRQHDRDDVVAEADGTIVGKAGFLSHYNPPYGDVYMEVDEPYRGRGIGSVLVQEAKRACYEAGRRPSARCNADNLASRRTLQRAGFLPCARFLRGQLGG